MYTRKDYLNGLCTHKQYYAQFVTPQVRNAVLTRIGRERLVASDDEHLNDISLQTWDSLPQPASGKLRELGDFITKAGAVCIYKEAARQILAEGDE